MKKKIKFIIANFLLITLAIGFNVQAALDQQTVNYLQSQQQNAWITQGLKASGETNLDIGYLDSFSGSSATDFAKAILAVSAAGENPSSFNGQNLVEGLLGYQTEGQLGSVNLLNDDIWGILALAAAGEPEDSEVITASKNYLLDNQHADGGWGYSPNADSDSNDTAAAVMALLEAGLSSSAEPITAAINYLQSMQNSDGGFGFYEDSESDSGSTAWIVSLLNKLDISPSSWYEGENNPLTFLNTLSLGDGSYKWVSTDTEGNALMTAYVAVALSGSTYPVAVYETPAGEIGEHDLRIEGLSGTICDDVVNGATVMEVLENGQAVCGYQINIRQTDFGPYVQGINDILADGDTGWLYWVNFSNALIGADQYQLNDGDSVLWSFGQFNIQPTRLSLSEKQVSAGEEITATVEYFNGQNWLAVNQAVVYAGSDSYQTNQSGQAVFSFNQPGSYEVYAEKDNFVRSNRKSLIVGSGSGVSRSLSMVVKVDNPTAPPPGNTLSFVLDTDQLDFGTLGLGSSATRQVRITNNGDVPVYLESVVNGDQLFEGNLYINNQLWEDYSSLVGKGENSNLSLKLTVPSNYSSSGDKGADLIFWGSQQ